MAKNDSASKRLAHAIAHVNKQKPVSLGYKMATMVHKGPLPDALQLNESDPVAGPSLAAFKAFGLDHQNIFDWRILLHYLAVVRFGNKGPGAPKIWNDQAVYDILLADVAAIKSRRPKATDADICRWLKKGGEVHRAPSHGLPPALISPIRGKALYAKVSAARLRRILQDARNPDRNGDLAKIVIRKVESKKERALAAGESWTGDTERQTTREARAAIIYAVKTCDWTRFNSL